MVCIGNDIYFKWNHQQQVYGSQQHSTSLRSEYEDEEYCERINERTKKKSAMKNEQEHNVFSKLNGIE